MMTPRFVILHHRLDKGEHWDFMLELDDALATWQLRADPATPSVFPLVGQRIGDHRKAYLEYEGPVSRDRGTVRRIDEGHWTPLAQSDRQWLLQIEGRRWVAMLRLRRLTDLQWRFEWVKEAGQSGSVPTSTGFASE